MIKLRYNAAQIRQLLELLFSHHTIKIQVNLLTLDHEYVRDLTSSFMSGQVNFDTSAAITRSLDLTLFDPAQEIHIDPNTPSPTGIYIKHMIRVMYIVISPDGNARFEIPVFCGPIDDVERDSIFMKVKCLGKETLSLGNAWRAREFKKGTQKTKIIREILTDMCGEKKSKIDVPDLKEKIGRQLKVSRKDKPFEVAKKLARSMGYQLFYDGRGVARMRKPPDEVKFVFHQRHITSEPTMAYDLSKVINAVDLSGKKPKKGKTRPGYRAVANQTHPLSPHELGRGKPRVGRFLWKEMTDDEVRTNTAAKRVATKELHEGLIAGIELKFDGMHNPLMEELDKVRLSGNMGAEFRMRSWTLPLVASSDASYGYIRMIRVKGGRRAGGKSKRRARR